MLVGGTAEEDLLASFIDVSEELKNPGEKTINNKAFIYPAGIY